MDDLMYLFIHQIVHLIAIVRTPEMMYAIIFNGETAIKL